MTYPQCQALQTTRTQCGSLQRLHKYTKIRLIQPGSTGTHIQNKNKYILKEKLIQQNSPDLEIKAMWLHKLTELKDLSMFI